MKQIRFFLIPVLIIFFNSSYSQNKEITDNNIPFSTDTSHLTIWNGEEYIPFFVKGINLGVAIPGKFPGELQVTKEQYANWFELIKDAGYNSIRLYTLHYPHFYEVLDSFNMANSQNPLFFFQGIWLEEEYEGFDGDLFFLTDFFTNEIEENIDCVHGNRYIEPRLGKAWGNFSFDASKWLIGYIIGRETYPQEILLTNDNNSAVNSFSGNFLSISECSPSESWITARLNHVIDYENFNYDTQHPVSYSSWPTLDPMEHPFEGNEWEDSTTVNLSIVDASNAPAGMFVSYHAYPYYPDFVSEDPEYQDFYDYLGPNSYLGYLTNLKNHYPDFPLIIAEFGVPSSWGVAHYSTSGMNHGGQDQIAQGETDLRLLESIRTAGCGGGIQFSLIDEWFKRTWITDPIDFLPDRRILWHNIAAAEQNFGLIEFKKPLVMQSLETYDETNLITEIKAGADYTYLFLTLSLSDPLSNPAEMWIGFDTYNSTLGESILPDGQTVTNRAEFALKITNYSAELYVTEAYDLFGIWHEISGPEQLFHSIATDGAPWYIVRWKNNNGNEDVQYIGNLKVNQSFLPESSKDAVTIYNDSIEIRIPWSLLQFVDPSTLLVFDDDRVTPEPETSTSDGIAFSIFYKTFAEETTSRFVWDTWNTALDVVEMPKTSYYIMKNNLDNFNNQAIAFADSFNIENSYPFIVNDNDGVLNNDFDMDGDYLETLLLENTSNGIIDLELDGSFSYTPNSGFSGIDDFTYCIFDGYSLSNLAKVYIYVDEAINEINNDKISDKITLNIYPNPVSEILNLEANKIIKEISIFNLNGNLVFNSFEDSQNVSIDISGLNSGLYFVKSNVEDKVFLIKFIVTD